MCSLGFNVFLAMWLGFLLVMIGAISAVLLWAVRSRQFSNQDRARSLPLWSGIPNADGKGKSSRGNAP